MSVQYSANTRCSYNFWSSFNRMPFANDVKGIIELVIAIKNYGNRKSWVSLCLFVIPGCV